MILFWLSLAQAGVIEAWEREEFGSGQILHDYDGWTAGWSGDQWVAAADKACATTDRGVEEASFEGYGKDTAADNWLIRGETIRQGSTRITFDKQDDDAFGLVSNLSGDSFYLLFVSSQQIPPPQIEMLGYHKQSKI